jgi:hypothetical protein
MLGTDKRDNDAAFNAAFWPGDSKQKEGYQKRRRKRFNWDEGWIRE